MSDIDRPVYEMPPGQPFDENGVPTCTQCGCQDFEVTHVSPWYSRQKKRRHVCKHCGMSYRSTQTWDAE